MKKPLTDCEEIKRTRKLAGRFSVPPYWVVLVADGVPIVNFPNLVYQLAIPQTELISAGMMQDMLLSIRRDLRWSRATLALALGVSPHTLRRWETGDRRPTGAARRLVWLVDRLMNSRKATATALDLMVARHGEEVLEVNEAEQGRK